MQITAGCHDTRMAESGLDEMDRGAAVERVGCVGVPEPMRGYRELDASTVGRGPNDT